MNFADFGKRFKNEQTCINFLIKARWGSKKNICCPRCNHNKVYIFKNNKTFKCTKCLKQFSIRIGTIFEGSNIPLYKWFFAIYLFTSFKKGVYLLFSFPKCLERLKKRLGLCWAELGLQ